MQIVSTFDQLNKVLCGRRSCLTIGVFDGLHLGHQALVGETVTRARQSDIISVAVTFSSHPLAILAKPYTPLSLITSPRKANLLAHMGIDIVVMIPFTKEFASVSPDRFVSDFLIKKAAVKKLVCGYDFTFGSQGAGNVETLKDAGIRAGFDVYSVAAVLHENHAVKSTHIRDLLSEGYVSKAASLLTRPHELPGIVGSGMQRGRTIGFPTANLQITDSFQSPGGGVYLCGARIGAAAAVLPAMVNIGTNPTFGKTAVSIEAHLLDFNDDIYGQALELYFLERLRDEQKFSGADALVTQLNEDRDQAKFLWNSEVARRQIANVPDPIDHFTASTDAV